MPILLLQEVFTPLNNPRQAVKVEYPLVEILVIALCEYYTMRILYHFNYILVLFVSRNTLLAELIALDCPNNAAKHRSKPVQSHQGTQNRVGYLFTEFLKKALAGIEFWAVERNIADVDMRSTDDLFGTMRSGLVLVEGNACFYFVGNKVEKCLMTFWGHIGKKRGNQVAPQGFDCNVEIAKIVTEFRCPLRANATGGSTAACQKYASRSAFHH